MALSSNGAADGRWTCPEIKLPQPVVHPVVAATADELARLRAAWKGRGPNHDAVAGFIARVEKEIAQPVEIPPGGGQHNQWYQCEKCQVALKTVDPTHHQCPRCRQVYSGFPYDNVPYTQAHHANSGRAERAGWAYAVTGRKEFAGRAGEILRRYAGIYLEYPPIAAAYGKPGPIPPQEAYAIRSAGRILNQTLNEAMWLVEASAAYDLVHDALTPADRELIERRLLRPMCQTIAKHPAGKSNWQTWHNAAFIWAGAVLGDEPLVRRAVADPANGFAFQMTASVSAEGMWYENSWGYHYYTLRAMTRIAEAARRLGIDLYGHPAMKRMYLVGFDYRMADGSLPRFADTVQDTPAAADVNEPALAAYGDRRLAGSLPARPTFQGVMLGIDRAGPATRPEARLAESMLFPDAGHAILRSTGPAGLSAAITFGPYGGFHGHFDKLSFVLFGFGQELAVDPGRAASQAYRLPVHQRWYKSTISHNAVLVDGRGQKEAAGRCLFFRVGPDFAAVAAECDQAFAEVRHRRFLLLAEPCLLVLDELEPKDDRPHSYWWLYHNRGAIAEPRPPAEGQARLPDAPGVEFLRDVAGFAPAGDIAVRFDLAREKLAVHLRLAGQGGDELFTATGPFRSVEDRVSVVLVRRAGRVIRFLAAVEPVKEGGRPTVEQLVLDDTGGKLKAVLTAGGRQTIVEFADGRIGRACSISQPTR